MLTLETWKTHRSSFGRLVVELPPVRLADNYKLVARPIFFHREVSTADFCRPTVSVSGFGSSQ